MKTVALIGTLDTKSEEYYFLKTQIEKLGLKTLVIDTGVLANPNFTPDVSAEEVAAAGGCSLAELREVRQPDKGIGTMGKGAATIVAKLCKEGKIHGAIAMGGGQGTSVGVCVMQALPIGFPKVLLSTIATLVSEPFRGINDTLVMNPIVDIAGLNSILTMVLTSAAGAIAGMVNIEKDVVKDQKTRISATMFGVTTKCVDNVRQIMENNGYELLVFHSTGIGGPVMEKLIGDGFIQGVIDVTTSEVSQHFIGGVSGGGPNRLEMAGKMGLPQVISLGGIDIVNFLEPETIPSKFVGRKFHFHNPAVTLMRSSKEENIEIGKILAEKLNKSKGKVVVVIPLKGISEYDKEGGQFYDPEADNALFVSLKENLNRSIEVVEMESHINDKEFSQKLADKMLVLLKK